MKPLSNNLITSVPILMVNACVLLLSNDDLLGNGLVISGLTSIVALSLLICAILDLIKGSKEVPEKVSWAIVISMIPILGALLYISHHEEKGLQ